MACFPILAAWLQTHSALITALATIVLAGITGLYLIETRRIRLDSIRPHLAIIPFYDHIKDPAQFRGDYYLVLTNEGKGSAFNINGTIKYPLLTINQDPPLTINRSNPEIKTELLNVSYRPLPIGQGVKIPLEVFKNYNWPLLPNARFEITLNYEDCYKNSFTLNKTLSHDDLKREWDIREKEVLFQRYSIS